MTNLDVLMRKLFKEILTKGQLKVIRQEMIKSQEVKKLIESGVVEVTPGEPAFVLTPADEAVRLIYLAILNSTLMARGMTREELVNLAGGKNIGLVLDKLQVLVDWELIYFCDYGSGLKFYTF